MASNGRSRPRLDRPATPLRELLALAKELGIPIEIPKSQEEWPLWPPDHPHRKRACDSKAPYLYVEGAIAEAINAVRTRNLILRVYPCPTGIHYHLTKLAEWSEQPLAIEPPRTRRRRKP